jgi:RNA polymerase sigma-70 factor (ECF subfamily)
VSLEAIASSLDQSTARLEAILPDPGTSPSMNVQGHEQEIQLADQLSALPSAYREVIVLRHIEGLPFEEVGRRMERSTGAVRMLWLRAMQRLRERMNA